MLDWIADQYDWLISTMENMHGFIVLGVQG